MDKMKQKCDLSLDEIRKIIVAMSSNIEDMTPLTMQQILYDVLKEEYQNMSHDNVAMLSGVIACLANKTFEKAVVNSNQVSTTLN